MTRYLESLTDYAESTAALSSHSYNTPQPKAKMDLDGANKTSQTFPSSEPPLSSPNQRSSINPDTPITVLVIGPRGHGKTAFVRKLARMAGQDELLPRAPCTESTDAVAVFDMEISTSNYVLTLKRSGRCVPIGYIESHIVVSRNAGGWSVFTETRYSIALRDPAAPYAKLRLIDTSAFPTSGGAPDLGPCLVLQTHGPAEIILLTPLLLSIPPRNQCYSRLSRA